MDALNGKASAGSVRRQGSRLRRSQEWQDPYSSSDNEAPFDPPGVAHHQGSGHRHQYEDPRNVVDHRSIGRGSVKATTLGHGSMELLTGPRVYTGPSLGCPNGPGSGSDGEGYSQPPPKYPGYGSLPRNSAAKTAKGRNGGSRGRLSLRRGPSSSSTSDNNSDATDSEMPLHRRANGQASQSRESSE